MNTQGYVYWDNSKNSHTSYLTPTPSMITAGAEITCEGCAESIYPATHVTSQCTDQCVVIACNDPHELNECHGAEFPRCSIVCDDAVDCTNECDGFDKFLQCCTNYHRYPVEPPPLESMSSNDLASWDSSFRDLFCSCSNLHTPSSTSTLSDSLPFTDSHNPSLQSALPDVDTYPALPALPITFSHTPLPQQSDSVEISCMWGCCNAKFTSLAELVGHVNLEHLQPPANVDGQQIKRENAPTPPDITEMSCQWRDCNSYPPEAIPTTSSRNDQTTGVFNFLFNHLLNDHLGVPNDLPVSIRASQAGVMPELPSTIDTSADASEHPLSFRCQWRSCGRSFDNNEALTQHLTLDHIGSGKAYYECFWDGCNRFGDSGFSSKQKICRHLQTHTGHRPHQCNICQQYFSEAATLQQHMRRHTQEKPYVCDYPGCGKTFAITGALTIHKRIHNGQKPFKCKFCDKAFSESSNLSKHLRTHTGARPYSCTEPGCNKSFARPDQLTRHIAVHRKKSPNQSHANGISQGQNVV